MKNVKSEIINPKPQEIIGTNDPILRLIIALERNLNYISDLFYCSGISLIDKDLTIDIGEDSGYSIIILVKDFAYGFVKYINITIYKEEDEIGEIHHNLPTTIELLVDQVENIIKDDISKWD